MATKMRLTRMGKKKSPFYRVIVTDSRKTRDGQYIDQIGTYDPMEKDATKFLKIDIEKAKTWLSKGAIPTLIVKNLLSEVKILVDKALPKKKKNKRKNRLNPIKDRVIKEKPVAKPKSIVKEEKQAVATEVNNEAIETKKDLESVPASSEAIETKKDLESVPASSEAIETKKDLESVPASSEASETKKDLESVPAPNEAIETKKDLES